MRLLRGTESDILADGALDYPDAVLEKLDVIIASIHEKRDEIRAEIMQEGQLDVEPSLGRRRVRDVRA